MNMKRTLVLLVWLAAGLTPVVVKGAESAERSFVTNTLSRPLTEREIDSTQRWVRYVRLFDGADKDVERKIRITGNLMAQIRFKPEQKWLFLYYKCLNDPDARVQECGRYFLEPEAMLGEGAGIEEYKKWFEEKVPDHAARLAQLTNDRTK